MASKDSKMSKYSKKSKPAAKNAKTFNRNYTPIKYFGVDDIQKAQNANTTEKPTIYVNKSSGKQTDKGKSRGVTYYTPVINLGKEEELNFGLNTGFESYSGAKILSSGDDDEGGGKVKGVKIIQQIECVDITPKNLEIITKNYILTNQIKTKCKKFSKNIYDIQDLEPEERKKVISEFEGELTDLYKKQYAIYENLAKQWKMFLNLDKQLIAYVQNNGKDFKASTKEKRTFVSHYYRLRDGMTVPEEYKNDVVVKNDDMTLVPLHSTFAYWDDDYKIHKTTLRNAHVVYEIKCSPESELWVVLVIGEKKYKDFGVNKLSQKFGKGSYIAPTKCKINLTVSEKGANFHCYIKEAVINFAPKINNEGLRPELKDIFKNNGYDDEDFVKYKSESESEKEDEADESDSDKKKKKSKKSKKSKDSDEESEEDSDSDKKKKKKSKKNKLPDIKSQKKRGKDSESEASEDESEKSEVDDDVDSN